MAINFRDIPAILIERIEASWPSPAYLEIGETDDWPAAVLPALTKQRIVTEVRRSEAITCPGCEWQCRKSVIIRQFGNEKRVYIVCDEEPDHGRIPLPYDCLRRFAIHLRLLAAFIADELKAGPPKPSDNLSAFGLGTITGRNGRRHLLISMEDGRLFLSVGLQRESLVKALDCGMRGLALDAKLVRRLADRKETPASKRQNYVADRTQQMNRKKETEKRDRAISRKATTLYDRGGTTVTRVATEIAKTDLGRGLSPARIRRIITERRGFERKNSGSKSLNRK